MKTVSVALLSLAGTAIATDATFAEQAIVADAALVADTAAYGGVGQAYCSNSWDWGRHCKNYWGSRYYCFKKIYSCRTCASGTYASNNKCYYCPMGRYSARAGDTRNSCSKCSSGKFTQTPNVRRTSSSVCKSCDKGKFLSGAGNTASSCKSCTAGKFTSSKASTICSTCDVGKDSARAYPARSGCATCAATTFHNVALLNKDCREKKKCGKGQGVSNPGSATSDRDCENCGDSADEKYSNGNDDSACKDHLDCALGQGSDYWSLKDADKTRVASKCSPCSTTMFSAENGLGGCEARKTACAKGSKFVAGSTSKDADCIVCTGNTYNDKTDDNKFCIVKTTGCPAGEFLVAIAGNEADNDCEPCAAGHFKATGVDSGAVECAAKTTTCKAGNWLDTGGVDDPTIDNSCLQCDAKPEHNSVWDTSDGTPIQAHCKWDCATGSSLTHNSTKCGKTGASIDLKAPNSAAARLQFHDNGALVLTQTSSGSVSTCLEATLCGDHKTDDSQGGDASKHAHSRRLGEMDVRFADMEAKIGSMDARFAALEAKL